MLKSKFSISVLLIASLAASTVALAKDEPKSNEVQSSVSQAPTTLTPEVINRVSGLKNTLGIVGLGEREIAKTASGNELNEELNNDIKNVLKKYTTIEDKLAFLSGMNSTLKIDHLHVNSNFILDMSADDQKYVDVIYTSYLFRLYENTKGLDEKQAEIELNKLERATPFKFYKDDLDKIKKHFG